MQYDQEFEIGTSRIAADAPTYFIADIAANHDGDLGRAKDLIYLSKEAGADCAKFQHFLAKDIVSDAGFRSLGGQQSHQSNWEKAVFDVYEQYHCPRNWTDELIKTCSDADITFMTTPYDFAAVDMFAPLVPAFKIGSGDITWTEEISYVAKKGKPVLLACGAADMDDVERAVETILTETGQIVLMQCNTNYTGHLENFGFVNLNVLRRFAETWPGMLLGLSDHTPGHATVLGSVALGARVIEKHFTDDNMRTGPDHSFAMNPVTWREMVDRTRELEAAMGDGVKRIEGNETGTVIIQRRSIRTREDVPSGTALTRDMLEVLRPCPEDGLPPYLMEDVIGRKLNRNLNAGEHLRWTDLD